MSWLLCNLFYLRLLSRVCPQCPDSCFLINKMETRKACAMVLEKTVSCIKRGAFCAIVEVYLQNCVQVSNYCRLCDAWSGEGCRASGCCCSLRPCRESGRGIRDYCCESSSVSTMFLAILLNALIAIPCTNVILYLCVETAARMLNTDDYRL